MCKTAYEKEKNALYSEIKNLFDSWLSDDKIDIDSIIVINYIVFYKNLLKNIKQFQDFYVLRIF